jgi:hypothetical protein
MSRGFHYLVYGIVMTAVTVALAYVIASAFDFSWLVISMILLTILTIGLLTNVVPTEGSSGPIMHPNPGSGQSAGYTPQDVGVFEHIMREDRPSGDDEPVPADKRFVLMAIAPGIAMLVAILAWIARTLIA